MLAAASDALLYGKAACLGRHKDAIAADSAVQGSEVCSILSRDAPEAPGELSADRHRRIYTTKPSLPHEGFVPHLAPAGLCATRGGIPRGVAEPRTVPGTAELPAGRHSQWHGQESESMRGLLLPKVDQTLGAQVLNSAKEAWALWCRFSAILSGSTFHLLGVL